VKVTYPRTILIQEDGQKPVRFTDAAKAAEYWARIKEQEWIEKHKDKKEYQDTRYSYRGPLVFNTLFDDARIRYRKLKRRAQTVFKRILAE
jgi:hypothetical protein